MLQLQNYVDKVMYAHNDNRSIKDIKYNLNELLFFIFSKYKERLPQQYQQKNCMKFFHQMAELRKSRYVCGVLLWNEFNDLLCIIDSTGKLNLPKGKEDYDDFKDKKTTGFRELGEEGGIKLSKTDLENYNEYIEVKHTKRIRLYKVNNFPKSTVNLNHTQHGEVKELCWLPQSELKNTEYNGMKFSLMLKRTIKYL